MYSFWTLSQWIVVLETECVDVEGYFDQKDRGDDEGCDGEDA